MWETELMKIIKFIWKRRRKMREIKFRGKLLNSGKWAYGNLDIKKTGTAIITPDKTALGTYGRVEPETIGQYTGLHDKKGQEIYEGDIVKITFSEEIMPIVFNKARFVIVDKYNNRFELYEFVNNLEVIGNTTDNPELLESE